MTESTKTALVAAVAFALLLGIVSLVIPAPVGAEPPERRQQQQVVGGTEVEPGEYPHLVGLEFSMRGTTECGGVLIDSEWVLTAQHCMLEPAGLDLVEVGPGDVRIGLGSPDERAFTQVLNVTEIVRRAGFDSTGTSGPPTNDIALLRLAAPADLSDPGIDTIALPTEPPDFATPVVVAGWGDMDGSASGVEYSPIAHKAELETVRCPRDDPYLSNRTHLCADSAAGRDSCAGDSGGPLIIDGKYPRLVALVESGPQDGRCGVTGAFGVYQRVDVHLDWILETTGITLCGGRSVSVDLGAGDLPTANGDVILGTAAAETIDAGAGDDVVCALGGNDTIAAGPGNDLVFAGGGNDGVNGGAGDDTVYGQVGGDTLRGGDGDDRLLGGVGYDTLYGEAGADFLQGSGGNDRLYGGAGNDALFGKAGADQMWGELGDDEIYGASGDDEAYGGPGVDRLQGAAGRDILDGGDGDDVLYGQADDDDLRGGAGDDDAYGAAGNDVLTGGVGHDNLQGASGDDSLFGEAGIDILYGQAGNDLLDGGPESDTCFGGSGTNQIVSC